MPGRKRDKTTGLPLPFPVVPPTSICLKISVPNAPEYRQAIRGVLVGLGKPWAWAQTEGESPQPAYDAAELWRERVAAAVYTLDCEDPELSCLDVANCIDTDETVQAAIASQVLTNPAIQTIINNTSTIGAPMGEIQRGTAVAGDPGCDPDVIFGSVSEVLDQLDTNNRDFLEIIELGTNGRERVTQLISAIPLIGSFPADEALAFLDKLQAEILEGYEAAWTTALRDEYRCDLFCIARDAANCELTFQNMVEYFNNRLGTALEPINFFQAVSQYFILGTWAGSTIVDIMMLIQLSAWQEASNWLGVTLRTLQTVGLLGSNNPDPDWALICDECNDEVTCADFTLGSFGWDAGAGTGYTAGQGFARVPSLPSRIGTGKTLGNAVIPVVRVVVTFNEPHTGYVRIRNRSGGQQTRQDATARTVWNLTGANITNGLTIEGGPPDATTGTPLPSTLRIVSICYYYAT